MGLKNGGDGNSEDKRKRNEKSWEFCLLPGTPGTQHVWFAQLCLLSLTFQSLVSIPGYVHRTANSLMYSCLLQGQSPTVVVLKLQRISWWDRKLQTAGNVKTG